MEMLESLFGKSQGQSGASHHSHSARPGKNEGDHVCSPKEPRPPGK